MGMASKIILSADSTCDIGPELEKKHNVQFFHYHIQVGDKSYIDKLEITPEELYSAWREKGLLPKTAAIAPGEYAEFFEKWVHEGYEVVHINLGSDISAAHHNCMLAAKELGRVYPVDSASLSTGSGHLVIKAAEMIEKGLGAKEIQQKLLEIRHKTQTCFVLDTLEFMAAGGRCSAVAAFGANLLKLKPSIRVDNQNGGRMSVGKKYRGNMEKVLVEYVRDLLENRTDLDLDRAFVSYSGGPQSDIDLMLAEIKKYIRFKEVHVTRASGTISSHCGPRTLALMLMTK